MLHREDTMNTWGGKMTDALFTIAEMAAVGFAMPEDTFTSRMMCVLFHHQC